MYMYYVKHSQKNFQHTRKGKINHSFIALFRIGLFGAAHGWEGAALWYIFQNDKSWHSYTLTKEDPKNR